MISKPILQARKVTTSMKVDIKDKSSKQIWKKRSKTVKKIRSKSGVKVITTVTTVSKKNIVKSNEDLGCLAGEITRKDSDKI